MLDIYPYSKDRVTPSISSTFPPTSMSISPYCPSLLQKDILSLQPNNSLQHLQSCWGHHEWTQLCTHFIASDQGVGQLQITRQELIAYLARAMEIGSDAFWTYVTFPMVLQLPMAAALTSAISPSK